LPGYEIGATIAAPSSPVNAMSRLPAPDARTLADSQALTGRIRAAIARAGGSALRVL